MTALWLDDKRDPSTDELANLYLRHLSEGDTIYWAKNYTEFVRVIKVKGLPDEVYFDHDLDVQHYCPKEYWDGRYFEWRDRQVFKEKTGEDCARFLSAFCLEKGFLDLPVWNIHSFNPVGAKLITDVLLDYLMIKSAAKGETSTKDFIEADKWKLN